MQSCREASSFFFSQRMMRIWADRLYYTTLQSVVMNFNLINTDLLILKQNFSRETTSLAHFVFGMHRSPNSASLSLLLGDPIFLQLWCWQLPRAAWHCAPDSFTCICSPAAWRVYLFVLNLMKVCFSLESCFSWLSKNMICLYGKDCKKLSTSIYIFPKYFKNHNQFCPENQSNGYPKEKSN